MAVTNNDQPRSKFERNQLRLITSEIYAINREIPCIFIVEFKHNYNETPLIQPVKIDKKNNKCFLAAFIRSTIQKILFGRWTRQSLSNSA